MHLLSFLYLTAGALLALFGFMGFVTLGLRLRYRLSQPPELPFRADSAPFVTVQLPIFNESMVVANLIDAAASLDYPVEKLEIQALDDSSDETTRIAADRIDFHRARGVHIELFRRARRDGFKAGALQAGLSRARGELVAVFDADFVPPRDFLRRVVPHLLADSGLGLVQTRWSHLNWEESLLTGAQAIALDKHFIFEQCVRFQGGFFPKFNGSAGVWRRQCLELVGGWESDTLCEDLCVSIRAFLGGWKFLFLPGVTAPAELPRSFSAYKIQQARWAQGSTQCLLKFARRMALAPGISVFAKVYALLTMSAYLTSWAMLLMLILLVPLAYLGFQFPWPLLLLGIGGLGQPALFLGSQILLHADWRRRLRFLPGLLVLAVAIAPTIAAGVWAGMVGRRTPFHRTPKGGVVRLQAASGRVWAGELFSALWAAVGIAVCLLRGNPGPLGFFILCLVGFSWALFQEWKEPANLQTQGSQPELDRQWPGFRYFARNR